MLRCGLPLAALGMLLASCQPPTYDISAHVGDAGLVFEARGSGSWPLRDDDGISADWVQVRDRERLIWAIQRDPDRPACKPAGETPPFPLVYGRTPECYIEKVAAKPPRDGAVHRIEGEGFRSGQGFFTLTRTPRKPANFTVGNPIWDEIAGEVESWPNLPDPRFPPGPGNGEPYSPPDDADDEQQLSLGNAEAPAPPSQARKNIPAAPAAAESSATSK